MPHRDAAARVRLLRRIALLAVLIPACATALVIGSAAIPDRFVVDQIGHEILAGRLVAVDYGTGTTGHQIDNFTDCLGITIGLGSPEGTNIVETAINSPTLGRCTAAVPRIQGYLDGEGLETNRTYFRYWHGYSVVLRPMIAVAGLRGTRLILFGALVAVLGGLGRSVWRRHGPAVSLVLFTPFVFTTDYLELAGSLPHACGMLAMLSTSWFVHERVRRRSDTDRIALTSMLAGSIVVFMDIFTTPAVGWALSVFLVGLVVSSTAGSTPRIVARSSAVAAAAWIGGYAWTWLMKWIAAGFVLGFGTVRTDITNQTQTRLSGDNGEFDGTVSATTRANLSVWWHQPLSGLVAVGLAVVIVGLWWRHRADRAARVSWSMRLVLVAPIVIPFVWFELLRNHSQVHVWFTYRSIAIVLGMIAAIGVLRRPARSESAGRSERLSARA